MTTQQPPKPTNDVDAGRDRRRRQNLLIGIAVVTAILLAGALHVVGVLPPG